MRAATIAFRDRASPYLFGVALIPLCVLFGTADGYDSNPLIILVHSFDLIVHEAGHALFRPLGGLLYALGGSILQIALPALFVYQGVYWHNRIGTQLALLLLGQNFVDVAIYAADAQARALPLLGGNKVFHDWHRILSQLGMLESAPVVAGVLYLLAVVTWVVMLIVPRWIQ